LHLGFDSDPDRAAHSASADHLAIDLREWRRLEKAEKKKNGRVEWKDRTAGEDKGGEKKKIRRSEGEKHAYRQLHDFRLCRPSSFK